MKKYKISEDTLAILPTGENSSLIYEINNVLVINNNPNNIIKSNILIDGSTYEGRIKNVKDLTGYTYKSPILVESKKNIIFFPTCSPRLKKVSWININSIYDLIYDKKNKLSIIKLINGNNIDFKESIYSINNQILRASRYEILLRKKES